MLKPVVGMLGFCVGVLVIDAVNPPLVTLEPPPLVTLDPPTVALVCPLLLALPLLAEPLDELLDPLPELPDWLVPGPESEPPPLTLLPPLVVETELTITT